MSSILETQTPASNRGTVAIAIGTVIATAQPIWAETSPLYVVEQTTSSYSEITEKVLATAGKPQTDFIDRITSIYSDLRERQQLLGAEFEAAIFDDLDSLYEA